jgi:O-antigen/teichoic acid export membrane protein
LSIAGSGETRPGSLRANAGALLARLQALLAADDHHTVAQRQAGMAFVIRVVAAGLVFVSQIVLARWMGRFEFGIYVYVWTWLVLLGGLMPLGISIAAQRFIPEYTERGDSDRLRGFLAGSRWLCFGLGTAGALAGVALIWLLQNQLAAYYILPFALACACLPAYATSDCQDGIARSYNWIDLAIGPVFLARPLLVLGIMALMFASGWPMTANAAMAAATAAIWATCAIQFLMLERRLRSKVERGPRHYEPGVWLKTGLPIFMVESFYFLLTYTDILVLEIYAGPGEVAVYYAATKTLALVAFVYYAVSAATAHRFSEYHVAGDREKLEAFLASAIRWTFWPSLVATIALLALGKFILQLFGPGFDQGYSLLFVLAIGLLARAAVGPVERLLMMVGEQRICAVAYGLAFVLNLSLCTLLIPRYGGLGAAMSTATALIVESILLFLATRRRLGLHVFIWRG